MDVLDYLFLDGEVRTKPLPKKDTKTDVYGYYKTNTGAVVSKDVDALKAYKARRAKENQINRLTEEVSELKSDIAEIKELLRGLNK